MPLDDKTVQLASEPNFAVLTTSMPDGTAQSHVMWVDTDGDNILINTDPKRQKARNVERSPKVTVTVIDRENPYTFAEVRGTVVETLGGQKALDHIDELSRKYTGHDYANPVPNGRLIVVIKPDRELVRSR